VCRLHKMIEHGEVLLSDEHATPLAGRRPTELSLFERNVLSATPSGVERLYKKKQR